MLSGLPIDNNDALSRRDAGLEFLDVSSQVGAAPTGTHRTRDEQIDSYRLTNHGTAVVDTHLLVVVHGLPDGVQLRNASGMSRAGAPYLRLYLAGGVLLPGQSTPVRLRLQRSAPGDRHVAAAYPDDEPVRYTLELLSGQGQP